MKKALIVGGGVVVGLISAAAITVYLALGNIVASAVEKHGSALLGTPVTVERVEVALFDGYLSVHGLKVKNPRGFKAETIFSLAEIVVEVDLATVREDLIIVKRLSLIEPHIFLELEVPEGSNLATLGRNVDAYVAKREGRSIGHRGAPPPAREVSADASGDPGPRLIIREFQMLRAELFSGSDAKLPSLQKFPDFEITDVGADKGGATLAEVAQYILGIIGKRMLGF